MTVRELTEQLEYLDQDAEIRVATQPSWPLRCRIQNVVSDDEITDHDEEDDRRAEPFVWIAVDQISSYDESPYAPRGAWSA